MSKRRNHPGRPSMGNGEKAKDFKGTMGKLIRYLKPYYLKLILVMIFAVGSTIFSIVGPKILAKATDKLSQGIMAKVRNVGGIDFSYIIHILLILLVLYLVSALFNYIQGWITSGISQKVAYDFRKDISEKMNRLPLSYFALEYLYYYFEVHQILLEFLFQIHFLNYHILFQFLCILPSYIQQYFFSTY